MNTTVDEQKTTPRVSFGINKTISRISTSIRQTVFRLSADIDASIGRVVGEISHWIDVAVVLFRHRESAKETTVSNMWATIYNDVLLKSVDVAQIFCGFAGPMAFSFRHRETAQTFCSAAYDLATLLESADVQRHSIALGTAYDTVFQSIDIALNEAHIRYTRTVLLEDYTFAIGDPDIKLSDWCYTELDNT